MKGPTQPTESKKGEIAYRKKLFEQHVEGARIFEDEYDAVEILDILHARMDKTERQMGELVAKGVEISPFIELGAERGQRSLVLVNDFDARGFALDLSFHSLKAVRHVAERCGLEKLPVLVCCDAYNLPFRNNALPFAFCYLTVHHFPDPAPIIAEIHRVLGNGHFFFDEEPFRRGLHLKLYKRTQRRRGPRSRRGVLTKVFQAVFSEVVHTEDTFGITENEEISCSQWQALLAPFDSVEATLQSPFGVRSRLAARRLDPLHRLNRLMGGSLRALCRKVAGDTPTLASHWDALGCPRCRITDAAGAEDRAPLRQEAGRLRCTHCRAVFPVRDGVHFLFSEKTQKELYPDLSDPPR